MIQVEEKQGLGAGQKNETDMAKQVDLKVFRTYTNVEDTQWGNEKVEQYRFNGMDAISKAVQEWYKSGCSNNDLENIFIGAQRKADDFDSRKYTVRPRYEKLENVS